MRPSLSLLIAAASSVLAQVNIPNLPSCAQNCVVLPSQCNTLDYKCICGDSTFISNVSCCVFKACSTSDQNTVIQFADSLCSGQGVTVPSSASCASTASATGGSPGPTASGNGTVMTASASATQMSSASTMASHAGAARWMPQAGGLVGAIMGVLAIF